LDGRGVEQVIFVTGLIRKGQRPQDLVEALFREAEVAPFLVTFGEERLLLGLLAPRPPKAGGHSVPVLKVLEERLTEVEIQRDSISTLVPVIDHRYGGLLESVDAPQLPRPKRGS
jgi:hypothetical protein